MPPPTALTVKLPAAPLVVAVRISIVEVPVFDAFALVFATVPVPKQGGPLEQLADAALMAASRFRAVPCSFTRALPPVARRTETAVAVLAVRVVTNVYVTVPNVTLLVPPMVQNAGLPEIATEPVAVTPLALKNSVIGEVRPWKLESPISGPTLAAPIAFAVIGI